MDIKYETMTSSTYTQDTASFDIDALEEVMKEFRSRFNDDISRALFSSPPNPFLRPPKMDIKYEPDDRSFYAWRNSFGMSVYESQFVPIGDGLIVPGYGVVIGVGPAFVDDALDKFGLDLGFEFYALPKWAVFAILAAALMILVLLLA